MVNTRLQIGTNENVGYFDNIPISITYQIADIRSPENRKGSFSKTIDIPGSKEVNILFENIFETNISLQTFDPRLKTEAVYYVDELPQIKGYIQLLNIKKDETTGQVIYQCSLIGELTTFFTDIKGLYLTDLDFSEINHVLNGGNIIGSWANTSGSTWTSTNASKAYPLIDWGDNKSNLTTLTPKNFRLCLFARDILLKMFVAQGYTWTSSFLDSDLFKRLIVTPTKGIALDSTTIANNKMLAVANGTEKVYNGVSLTYNVGILTYSNSSYTSINFQTDTAPTGYDTGGIFTTPTLTPAVTNSYNTSANIGISVVVKKGVSDVSSITTVSSGSFDISILKGSSVIATSSIQVSGMTLGSSAVNNVSINIPNTVLTAGQNYVVKIQATNIVMTTVAGAGTYTMDVTVANGSNFSTEFASNQAYEGITINANNAIPENIKQEDFFKSIIRMFNLYVTVDKTNPYNYIIEPREDFYLTTARDWTYKHDDNSVTEIKPVGELNYNKYKFRYKEDKDYYNTWHKDTFKETYGYDDVDVTSDFVKAENMIDVIFSPTPYAKSPYSNIVTAAILNKQNGVITEIASNVRILYYKQINLVNAQWTFTYTLPSPATVTYTNYPHAGHSNSPYSPSIDINWGLPNLPYVYPNQFWTTNNLQNTYYSRYINQITDKNSKIVVTDFWLTPLDIHIFDFRYPIFWKDAYYLVNKLDNNPIEGKPSRVELLKLTNYDAFTPTDIDMSGGVGGGNMSGEKVFLDNLTKGDNNNNFGSNSMIVGGSGNYIANG